MLGEKYHDTISGLRALIGTQKEKSIQLKSTLYLTFSLTSIVLIYFKILLWLYVYSINSYNTNFS